MYFIRRLSLFFMLCFCIPLHSETLVIGIRNDVHDPGMLKAAEWIKEAVQASGHKIQFDYLPAKRSLKLASIGYLDGEFYRHTFVETKFPSLVRVDIPLGKFDYDVWIYAGNNCMEDIDALEQLKPVGIRGVVFFEDFIYPKSDVGYEEVANIGQAMEILQRGRADYTVHNKSVIEFHSKKSSVKLRNCFDTPLFSKYFYLYLHESNRHLVESIEQTLREAK